MINWQRQNRSCWMSKQLTRACTCMPCYVYATTKRRHKTTTSKKTHTSLVCLFVCELVLQRLSFCIWSWCILPIVMTLVFPIKMVSISMSPWHFSKVWKINVNFVFLFCHVYCFSFVIEVFPWRTSHASDIFLQTGDCDAGQLLPLSSFWPDISSSRMGQQSHIDILDLPVLHKETGWVVSHIWFFRNTSYPCVPSHVTFQISASLKGWKGIHVGCMTGNEALPHSAIVSMDHNLTLFQSIFANMHCK